MKIWKSMASTSRREITKWIIKTAIVQLCYNSIYGLTLIHKWRWLRLISSYIWSCLSEIVVLFDQPPKKKETACLNLTSYMSGFDDKQYNWKKNFHKIKKKKKHFCNFFIFWKKIFLFFCIFRFFCVFFFIFFVD